MEETNMNKKGEKKWSAEEVVKKYNINISKLEKEQKSLAKNLSIKDGIDFSKVSRVGALANVFFQNQIISTCVVLDSSLEILEQKYFSKKAKFPYIPGFRAYRELPAMMSCFDELRDKPEVVFISGHGISHPRLGLASHFSLASGVPSIGVSDSLIVGEAKGDEVILGKKVIAKIIFTKEGSRPLYVSAGNMISLKSACELVKRFIKEPHKLPEPLHLAHKYGKEVVKELFAGNKAD